MKLALLCLCAVVLGAPAQALVGDLLSSARKVAGAVVTPDAFSQIKFVLFTPSYKASYSIDSVTDLLADPGFNASKPTALFMHGWMESASAECAVVVGNAFLQRGAENFVALDWSAYVNSPYTTAFVRVPGAGAAVGQAVDRLVAAGLNKDTFWPIGHSLGGQLAGNIARNIGFKLNRITALDPAGPGFGFSPNTDLTSDDAVLVDVIHTDGGVYGFGINDGTIDFWPNGGRRPEPGCPLVETSPPCSHQRSWRYFAESVSNPTAFPAVKCDSWLAFESFLCPANDKNVVYMGYAAPAAGLSGTFYLRTSFASPFGLGAAGERPLGAAATSEATAAPRAAPSNEEGEETASRTHPDAESS